MWAPISGGRRHFVLGFPPANKIDLRKNPLPTTPPDPPGVALYYCQPILDSKQACPLISLPPCIIPSEAAVRSLLGTWTSGLEPSAEPVGVLPVAGRRAGARTAFVCPGGLKELKKKTP